MKGLSRSGKQYTIDNYDQLKVVSPQLEVCE